MLRVMAQKVSSHIDHQNHGSYQVQTGSDDGMPEALRIGLSRSDRCIMLIHSHNEGNELERSISNVSRPDGKLTMPVAKYQEMIVNGKAMMYRIRRVKLRRRHIFPKKPQAREIALKMISLTKLVKI